MYKIEALIATVLLFSFAEAKPLTKDIRFEKGNLKKISCSFKIKRGFQKTPTGPSLGTVDFPSADPDQTVCDPLSNNASDSPDSGLVAKLILRTPEMGTKVSSVMDYYNKGLRLEQNIYFADVNVPTRAFTEGFSTVGGAALVDAQGNKVIENFAIEYDSVLKLSEGDKEGDYEIAILSDDGARVFIKENETWNELINNDGNHSTRLGCPYRTIRLTKESEVPMKILYYQGPRYHIANVLVWKLHKKAQTWSNPSRHDLCGIASNDFFFKKNQGKKSFSVNILQKTGWKTIAPANFKMPEKKQNPCTVEELSLSEFQVVSAQAPNAMLSWKTNLPASSQLRILNIFTGEEILTEADTTLTTDHSVQLSGLIRGIYYQVQAISVDAQGREIRSELINLLP